MSFQPTLSNGDEFILRPDLETKRDDLRHVQIVKRVPASHRQVGQVYLQRADEHVTPRK